MCVIWGHLSKSYNRVYPAPQTTGDILINTIFALLAKGEKYLYNREPRPGTSTSSNVPVLYVLDQENVPICHWGHSGETSDTGVINYCPMVLPIVICHFQMEAGCSISSIGDVHSFWKSSVGGKKVLDHQYFPSAPSCTHKPPFSLHRVFGLLVDH